MVVLGETEPAATPADWDRRSAVAATWWGRAVVLIAVLAAVATLQVNGDGMTLGGLAGSPHLLDLEALANDPVRSIVYLHAQVPFENLLVAIVGWLPVPLVGTLFAVYAALLLATGLLVHAVLVRWGTPPLAAGALAAVAMVNPALLATVGSGGVQVPVAFMAVAALWAVQRHLDRPSTGRLLVVAAVLSAGILTWQMLRPGWVILVLLLVLAARPVGRRAALGALAIPLVLVGGWAVKNERLFGEPTLASSVGFDLHQGITTPMSAQGVAAAVDDGTASRLAQQLPWGTLGYYGPDRAGTGPCAPSRAHPVTADEVKAAVPDDLVVPNYNAECYLPLYRQARHDALALATRYPGRYLTTRQDTLVLAYDTAEGCASDPCTWMDRLYQPLLGKVDGTITMYDWNLHLFGSEADTLEVTVSMVLVVASAILVWRGAVAAWRLGRLGWRRHGTWPTGEVVWLVAALTVVFVVGATTVAELGDNGRMRAALDPILLTLPLAAAVRWLRPEPMAVPAPSADEPLPSPAGLGSPSGSPPDAAATEAAATTGAADGEGPGRRDGASSGKPEPDPVAP
jgi:hypothetical protein